MVFTRVTWESFDQTNENLAWIVVKSLCNIPSAQLHGRHFFVYRNINMAAMMSLKFSERVNITNKKHEILTKIIPLHCDTLLASSWPCCSAPFTPAFCFLRYHTIDYLMNMYHSKPSKFQRNNIYKGTFLCWNNVFLFTSLDVVFHSPNYATLRAVYKLLKNIINYLFVFHNL